MASRAEADTPIPSRGCATPSVQLGLLALSWPFCSQGSGHVVARGPWRLRPRLGQLVCEAKPRGSDPGARFLWYRLLALCLAGFRGCVL